jgi:membrane protein DedA with SNARE-associated domain
VKWILAGMGAVVLATASTALLVYATDAARELVDRDVSDAATYFLVFFLVAGDAVIPIFPGETTLNAASVRASNGELELWLVMLAGSLGAVVGDSALYWIARLGLQGLQARIDAMESDSRVQRALRILGKRARMLIVFGRYVPGVRFLVNATMGMTRVPYPSFLLWSTIGGVSWAVYTCLLAYSVGSALDDAPLASVLVSGGLTTAVIAGIFWFDTRAERRAAAASVDVSLGGARR